MGFHARCLCLHTYVLQGHSPAQKLWINYQLASMEEMHLVPIFEGECDCDSN